MSGEAFYQAAPDGDLLLSADAMALLFDRPVEEVKALVKANPAGVIDGAVHASRVNIPSDWAQNARRRFREAAAATGSTDFVSVINHLRRTAS